MIVIASIKPDFMITVIYLSLVYLSQLFLIQKTIKIDSDL